MPADAAATLSLHRYAADAKALVAGAQQIADERRHAEVTPLHLLARSLERDPGVLEVFRRASVNVVELQAAVERALAEPPKSKEPAYLSAAMLDLLERADREADRERAKEVGVGQLLNALSQEIRGAAGEILGAFRVGPGALRPHLAALTSVPRNSPRPAGVEPVLSSFTRDLVEDARAGRIDPVVGRDAEVRRLLTILERRGKCHPLLVGEPGVGKGAVIGALARRIAAGDVPSNLVGARLLEIDTGALVAGARLRGEIEERVRKLLQSLSESSAESILVTRSLDQLFGQGPAGSGVGELLEPALTRGEARLLGTTTSEGLRKIAERAPSLLRNLTTLAIEEPSVERAIEIVRGAAQRYETHHAVQISEGAVLAAVRLAKRYVQDRFLPDSAIDLLDEAASTLRVESDGVPAEVDEALRRLESLETQLASLADADDAVSITTLKKLEVEAAALRPRVAVLRATLDARRGAALAVRSLENEIAAAEKNRTVAESAKEVARASELEHVTLPDLRARLDQATQAVDRAGPTAKSLLGEQDVAATLAVWTGIPVAKMLEGEAEKLLKMEERLEQRVVGQGDAVRAIARSVRRGRVGLRDPGKPIGSFLFLGPSGVGKTELAKALAEFLFDDELAMTRLDMSEFMEKHMAQRLIGAPPGYADSEQGGFLTEAVRRRPYSVLLFDEVEKAHQDVFNLLLQVLDDGRLTDGRGRLADFSNTVVIMTSNIGSDRILSADSKLFDTDEGRDALRDILLDTLRQFFRPELLNRIDDVVVFRSLTKEHLRRVVDIQLRRLERLIADRGLSLELDEVAKSRLVELGYDPALGARPLKRAILRHVQDPLAEALLAGKVPDGSRVRVTVDGDRFVIGA